MNSRTAFSTITGSPRTKLTAAFITCFISIMFAGISSMLMSVYLPVVVRDIRGNADEQQLHEVSAYINSFFIFGSMFGGFAWGYICDRIGRSRSVILCTAFYGLFTLLTAFTHSWMMITIFRFLTGFGVGGVLVTTNILICELWSPKNRAVALGIVSSAMPVGFIVAGAMNNLVSNWQNAFLVGVVPLLVAGLAVFILAESENWKVQHERSAPALFVRENRKDLLMGSLIFGSMLIGLWAVFSWAPTWVQSLSSDETQAQQLRGNTMMILALSGLVGSVISGWIANRIGVRNTLMICFAMCFVMVFVIFKLNKSVTAVTLAEMGVMSVFFGISQGALSVYIPLLFPTAVRASATGFCFNIGRLFTATVVFFIGALVDILGGYGNAIFIFSFVFIIGFFVTGISANRNQEASSSLRSVKN